MKLGLGLYRDLLTDDNFRFAKQAGATHLVIHLVDYFKGGNPQLSRGDDEFGWGVSNNRGKLWEYEELAALKRRIESHGLVWEAIENFDPAHWGDVLRDGPEKQQQMEDLKTLVRTVGRVGVPIIGYNFSLAAVWGWQKTPTGRGGAMSVGYDASAIDSQTPIPNGMVWNMVVDPEAPPGSMAPVSEQELWERAQWFLRELVPVAEAAGVRLAAHPDDPPVESLRGTARLVNQPQKYQRLLDLAPSRANGLEFCMGTIQEMTQGDLYERLDHHSNQGDICYIHFRNVRGKVPNYQEVFVDEGDIDMLRALRILQANGYEGVLIPDHCPEMHCAAPWHAGMAHALGYMKALLQVIGAA